MVIAVIVTLAVGGSWGGQLGIDASWGDYAAAYAAAGAAELETMINDAVATARTTYGG